MPIILAQVTANQICYGLGLHLMNYTNPVTLHTLTPVIPVRAIPCGCPYNIVASKGRRKTSHYDKKVYQKYNFTLTPVIKISILELRLFLLKTLATNQKSKQKQYLQFRFTEFLSLYKALRAHHKCKQRNTLL